MNSSTSISETGWRKLICSYVAWALALGIALMAIVIALDPYDTGRFALFGEHGVPHFGQRLADAGLARQPQFDTAIFGNSTIQLIDPSRLNAGGHHALSLAIPATGPREQLSVANWFMQHHPGKAARALIFDLDGRWCEADHSLALTHPFPFWLYSNDTGDYLINMMQMQSLDSSIRKIKLLLGRAQPMRADGYNDYEIGRTWDHAGFLKRVLLPPEENEPGLAAGPPYDFPAVSLLDDFLSQLPSGTAVLLVVPPQYHPDLSRRETSQQHACTEAFDALAAQRPHTRLIDFLSRTDLTSRDDDYWDRQHYRSRIARVMEETIDNVLMTQKKSH